jgi:hypothetical protein
MVYHLNYKTRTTHHIKHAERTEQVYTPKYIKPNKKIDVQKSKHINIEGDHLNQGHHQLQR